MLDALCSRMPMLLSTVLLLGSCALLGSDDNKAEDVTTYFRATLNQQEPWSGQPDAGFSQQGPYLWLAIGADSIYGAGYYRESLTLAVPYEGPGEYPLVPVDYDTGEGGILIAGAAFFESDDDARVAGYRATDEASANHLTLTRYDSTTGLLTGSFRAVVVVGEDDRISEPGEPPRRRADTLRFEEGTFRVKVRDLRP